jgi:pimeloyl-ACP methyl ester carboxylesterase
MADKAMRSRWVRAGAIHTHYTESGGDGPTLLLLHGAGYGQSGIAANCTIMPALGEDYRVIAPDFVGGYGKTDLAPTPRGIHSRVDQIEEFVDTLCLDKFSILGNSMGAWTAARYAILHPERIERMILVGSGSIAVAMGIERIRMEGTQLAESHGHGGTREDMRQRIKAIVHRDEMITEELVTFRLEVATRPGVEEANAAFGEATRWMQTDPRESIIYRMDETLPWVTKQIPTIFMWGENDHFASPEYGKQLEKLLPDVPFNWIPNAGHQVQSDQPEMVTGIIKKFLSAS